MNASDDDLETWRSADNNKVVICEKLIEIFSHQRRILEVGSGTGQHAVWFAGHMPHLIWQTSDRHQNLDFIRQRLAVEGLDNIAQPLELDVTTKPWSGPAFDGVFAANCIHIMAWDMVVSMFDGIGQKLEKDGRVVLYGPFKYEGEFTTPSNAQFDEWLKAQNHESGIRDFEAVDRLAQDIGLGLVADYPMPANNQLIVWG
jgi:cyclopropane fatty-acyl-phospholipid synthase-like methyltransferase